MTKLLKIELLFLNMLIFVTASVYFVPANKEIFVGFLLC